MTETVDVFDDALLAGVYDDLNPWGAWDDFYLRLARENGGGVLDLGCGTNPWGSLLYFIPWSINGKSPS